MGQIILTYSPAYLILCALLGIVGAGLIYYRNDLPLGAKLKYLLFAMRALALSLLATLLLNPFIKSNESILQKPTLVLLLDNSQSVGKWLTKNQLSPRKELQKFQTELSELVNIEIISLGRDAKPSKLDSIDYKMQSTNLSAGIKYLSKSYSREELAAVVMASDGIYNKGTNPSIEYKFANIPFYGIIYGDTTLKKDVKIRQVFVNEIAYLKDILTFQVDVSAYNFRNSSTKVHLYKKSGKNLEKIGSQDVRFLQKDDFITLEFKHLLQQTGVVEFMVKVDGLPGESTMTNNSKSVFVHVVDARQRVVILAHAPHPDIATYKQILSKDINKEVRVIYDEKDIELNKTNFLILHNYPASQSDETFFNNYIAKHKIPKLFVVGADTDIRSFNNVQNGIKIQSTRDEINEVNMDFDPDFKKFLISPDWVSNLKNYPPLSAKYGNVSAIGNTRVMAYQNIAGIGTKYPLVAFTEQSDQKTGYFLFEGIWKWKLFNYMEQKNDVLIEDLINKSINYTTLKEDKRKFKVLLPKTIFEEDESIRLVAQLYNDSYEPISTNDVVIQLKNSEGNIYDYSFSPSVNHYELTIDNISPGDYTFSAHTTYGGKILKDVGKFTVRKIDTELADDQARPYVLSNIVQRAGKGKILTINDIDKLIQEIKNLDSAKPVSYINSKTLSAIDWKWIFVLVALLLFVEWAIKRYFGLL